MVEVLKNTGKDLDSPKFFLFPQRALKAWDAIA